MEVVLQRLLTITIIMRMLFMSMKANISVFLNFKNIKNEKEKVYKFEEVKSLELIELNYTPQIFILMVKVT